MKYETKTKKQLIEELKELHRRNAEQSQLEVEHKRMEEALRKSEEKYKNIVENIHEVIMLTQPDGIISYLSPACKEVLGHDPEDLMGKQPWIIHPDDLELVKEIHYRALKGESGSNLEYRIRTKNGVVKWVSHSWKAILHNSKLQTLVSAVRDITERKRAEEELKQSEEKYRNLIEHSNDAIYLLYENKFEVINERFEKMFGVTQEEVRAPDFDFIQLVAPKSRELVIERAKMIAQGQEPSHRYEFSALTKKGKEVEVEVSVSYVPYRGGKATQGILRDITERKQLEAQLRQAQKMEAIGTLAGGIAHDFNNILTGISGYTQLAMAKLSPQHPLFEDLEKVEQAASRAAILTRQILAFSRRQVLEIKVLNLNKTIEDIMRFLRRIIGEHIDLNTVLAPELPSIKADPSAIEQILTNLCVNSRDAMPNGGELLIQSETVTLDEKYCEQHPWAAPGEFIMLLVSDTGIGMDDETLAHIFEPFFTTKEVGSGTGLGLAMVYGLVKQHNGFIDVDSELSRGTAFKIYFPINGEEEEKTPSRTEESEVSGGKERILVAEDEDSVRSLIVELLEGYGYTVMSEGNGANALRVFQRVKDEIDLVILDAVMPLMGGREAYEIMKEQSSQTKFLFISGYSVNLLEKKFILDQGMNLLKKPFTPNQLVAQVRQVLDSA